MNRSLFKHGGVTQGDVTDSYLFQSKLRFRPQNKPEIWLWLPDTRGDEDVRVVWSYLELQDPPEALTTRAIYQKGREGRNSAGWSGGGVCQGPGSLPSLFDLARFREHRHYQKKSSRTFFLLLAIITSYCYSSQQSCQKSCSKYAVVGRAVLHHSTLWRKNVVKVVFLLWEINYMPEKQTPSHLSTCHISNKILVCTWWWSLEMPKKLH